MIYIDDPVIENMFYDWWDDGRCLHNGECYECGATTTGSEKDIEWWIYEHAKGHMRGPIVKHGQDCRRGECACPVGRAFAKAGLPFESRWPESCE